MLTVTLTIVILFLLLVYYYLKSVYFTLRGPIPGIEPHFFFGNAIQLDLVSRQPAPLPDTLFRLKEKFGDTYQIWFGANRFIMINNLKDVQHIFSHRNIYDQGDIFVNQFRIVNPKGIICLKGAEFKRHATFTGPLFRRAKILIHLNTILDCTDKLLNRWRTNYTDPKAIHFNMIEQSQQLLMAVFGYVAFDYDLQTLDGQEDRPNELTQAFYYLLNATQILLALPIYMGKIFISLNFRAQRARKVIDRYLTNMIEQELQSAPEMSEQRKRTSLIASLVTSLQENEQIEMNKSEDEKKGLSKYEVMCEMLAFLGAGYGTTSTSLSWFIFFMSKHPEIQKKIKAELSEFNGQRFSVDQLESLVYLDSVLQELFRLTSPVLGTVRTLTTDDQLPVTGFQLSKGDSVMISFYTIARDKRYWSDRYDLNEFHPERFLDDPEHKNNLSALLAFGGGHRQCMGQDLARFELKVICARLMQFITFGDGGEEVNAGGYDITDTNKPKKLAVTVTFD